MMMMMSIIFKDVTDYLIVDRKGTVTRNSDFIWEVLLRSNVLLKNFLAVLPKIYAVCESYFQVINANF